jgi:hypothetical protein
LVCDGQLFRRFAASHIVRGFAEMSTRLEVECPQCCDVFPVVVGVIEELEVMEITEGRENAVVDLRCPFGHPFQANLETLRVAKAFDHADPAAKKSAPSLAFAKTVR